MSYDVFVTRKEFEADEEGAQIGLAEWLGYARTQPGFEVSPENGFVRWRDAAGNKVGYFELSDGSIHTEGPDAATIAIMLDMALTLGAKLQGADGELLGPGGRTFHEGPGPAITTPDEARAFYADLLSGEPLPVTGWDALRGMALPRPH